MGRHGKAGGKQRKPNARAAVQKPKKSEKGTSGLNEESVGQNGHSVEDHPAPPPPPPAEEVDAIETVDAIAELLADDATLGPRKGAGKSKQADPCPPPKKPGETKAQYEARINGAPSEPVAYDKKHRPLHIDPAEFEEEEPEKDETNDDYSDTQNERAREYKKGGYHPVLVGELYHERYRVVHKLGWGYFSTVWLVWDYKAEKFQAMKVQKSADHYRDAAFDEIKLLSQIMGADPTGDMCCTRMTDSFEHKGPHGVHVCMLFDVLGENLLSLIERYENRGVPIPIVKSLARETLIGLHHIHSIGIIHTDIKPENVLLSSPKHKIHRLMRRFKPPPIHERPSLLKREVNMMTKSQRRRYYQKMKKRRAANDDGDQPEPKAEAEAEEDAPAATPEAEPRGDGGEAAPATAPAPAETPTAEESETDPEWEVERFHHAALADFGNSCWVDTQFTDEVQTRQYRAPEVIIGDPYSTPIDLWSAACMFFELLTGEFLFDPKGRDDYPRDEDHLALMTELLGPLPPKMRSGNGKFRAQFYDSQGNFRHIQDLRYWSLRDVLHEKYRFSKKKAHEISNFLLPMLVHDPEERATALEMLTHFEDFFEVQEDDYSPLCYRTEAEEADEEGDDNEGDDELEELLDHEHGPHGHRSPGGEELTDQSSIDEDFGSEDNEEESTADDEGHEAPTGGKEALRARPGNSPPAHRKPPQHRAHRPSRHVDPEHERQIADAEWYLKHPILAPQQLAAHGLTIDDIKAVLADQRLSDPQKHVAAERIISQLVEQENAV